MLKLKTITTALCGLALSSGALAAPITTYSDLSSWQTAVPGTVIVEDFTGSSHFPISTGILNSATNLPSIGLTPGMIQPGVTYSTPIGDSFFFNIDAGGGFAGGFLDGFYGGNPGRVLNITFDGAVSAFAFDTNTLMGTDFDITINFASGPAYASNFAVSGDAFFGFKSAATDITSIVIDGNGNGTFAFALDNFRFTEPGVTIIDPINPVSEPGSLALMGLALAGLLATRRRKHG